MLQNPVKMLKPIFPYIFPILMPFPKFERLSVAKKPNATFFRVGGSNKELFSLSLNCLSFLGKKLP